MRGPRTEPHFRGPVVRTSGLQVAQVASGQGGCGVGTGTARCSCGLGQGGLCFDRRDMSSGYAAAEFADTSSRQSLLQQHSPQALRVWRRFSPDREAMAHWIFFSRTLLALPSVQARFEFTVVCLSSMFATCNAHVAFHFRCHVDCAMMGYRNTPAWCIAYYSLLHVYLVYRKADRTMVCYTPSGS